MELQQQCYALPELRLWCCSNATTIDNRYLTYYPRAEGTAEFEYFNTTTVLFGTGTNSCKNGSLLYNVDSTLADGQDPRLAAWNYNAAWPVRDPGTPFAQVAGMIMMFAFVLVLALAIVACCRGRRNLQAARANFLGRNVLAFRGHKVPEGPPPPPPPTVRCPRSSCCVP